MFPIKLTIQGLYSYQKKQTIDFSRLIEANIFGIFGAVGSGKSTILEAITFALYGKTDRLNLSGDNRNYNMMNLKSNDLLIEFVFKAGKDDIEYLATVKGRRNSKQFDDVKALDRAAYKKTDNQWLPIGTDMLEMVIGLSYENFKRTIIIPQNKFQEFLQLPRQERSQMMKEMFNLDKFELFYKVVALESKNNQQLQLTEGKIQQLGEITPEQVTAKEAAINALHTEIEQKNNELSGLHEKETEFRKTKELAAKINELQQTLLQLKEQEPANLQLEQRVREYEFCLLNFKNLLDTHTNTSAKVRNFEQTIHADTALLASIIQQITTLEKTFETIKKEYDTREILKQQAGELDKLCKILELNQGIEQLETRIAKGEAVCRKTDEKLEQIKQWQDNLLSALKELKNQYPDMALLSKVKEWHTIHQMLVNTKGDISNELIQVQKELQEITNHIAQLWNQQGFEGIPPSASVGEAIVYFGQKKEQVASAVNTLEQEIARLSVQAALEEYAANLNDGTPCPLCGSLSHPEALNPQNVSAALKAAKEQRKACEKTGAAIEQNQKKLSDLDARLHLKQEQVEQVSKKHNHQVEKISAHLATFTWEQYSDEKAVAQAFAMAQQLQQQIKTNEEEQEKLNAGFTTEVKNKEKYVGSLQALRHQLAAYTAERETLKNQLTILFFNDYENEKTEALLTHKETLLKKYQETEQAYQSANNKITLLQKEHDTVNGRLEANKKILHQETAIQKEVADKLQYQVKHSQYQSLTEVENILSQNIDIEKEKKKVDKFKETINFVGNQLTALEKEMGCKKYDEASHQQITALVKQFTEELTQKNQVLGKLQSELKKLGNDLNNQKELRSLQASLTMRAEDIKTLKQLFKASGFVNYISSVYLQELCNAANNRFYKLTKQRLSLEITADNNFQVRDFMNGGKTRSVKTLSGGQTFQAALSLALALADNVKEITGSSQNFFFLDEGFGSLDKESLDIVFDTLKALRKENRVVGVISHVEEMQQEIDAHLKISNDEEGGSIIKTSWSA